MIINKKQLLNFSEAHEVKGITESLQNFSNKERKGNISIFVSHKHDETKYLEAFISLLSKFSVDLYFDWLDEGVPKNTSGVTAKRIKDKIIGNDKFIFLATEEAINSKWCNWELGFGDANKYLNNIAIFPVEDSSKEYTGSEYLQIYPYIELVEEDSIKKASGGFFDKGFYVINPKNNVGSRVYIELSKWLKRNST